MFDYANSLIFNLTWPLPVFVIFCALVLAGIISIKGRALTLGGAFAAVLLGFCVTWALYLEGLTLFLLFFVLSNVAGLIKGKKNAGEKDDARNLFQVLANGFMAGLCAMWWFFSSSALALVSFGAVIAEAFADTLAGDIGSLSRVAPVSIITHKPVQRGTSGGVTLLGFFASFCASALIAVLWALFFKSSKPVLFATFICLAGFFGAVIDSVLGAWIQAVYTDKDGNYTEKATDKNGQPNVLVRGIALMDNDMVNFVSNMSSVFFVSNLYLIFK